MIFNQSKAVLKNERAAALNPTRDVMYVLSFSLSLNLQLPRGSSHIGIA